MSVSPAFSVLDLLDLPPEERELFLEISRNGPQTAEGLARSGQPAEQIQRALERLLAKNRIQQLPDKRYDVVMGKIGSRRTLPAQLWTALLAPQRMYSEQDIAILKTAIPMLQFARARLTEFADHGPSHALRVKTLATQLAYVMSLTDMERHLLRAAAFFHDIGNVVERKQHHQISQQTVIRLAAARELPFTPSEAELVGLLCRWHRRDYEPERIDGLRGEQIRTGLAASLLRVADAMDIDSRRSDYDAKFRHVLDFFFPDEVPYHTSLEEVSGVRIHCTPSVHLQVFTRERLEHNIQIESLHRDLASTPLNWVVTESVLKDAASSPPESSPARALLVFPFDAHSSIMAALSRKHLRAAGYDVEILCYPDTPNASSWLWREVLGETDPRGIAQLVVIGDRPEANVTPALLSTLAAWQNMGARVTILNRHEANWTRVPELLKRNAQVILGGDWAYFWGDEATHADMQWGRIAALCARDATMAHVRLEPEEQALVQGMLYSIFDAPGHHRAEDTDAWGALAEPLLTRIEHNDRAHLLRYANTFVESYLTPRLPYSIRGRIIVFDGAPGLSPQAFYWILERTIEQQGRQFGRGVQFNVPYALAYWREGDATELLAINHWREEEATPVRLLYPDIGPAPAGTESTVQVHLPPAQAALVVERLLEASNAP